MLQPFTLEILAELKKELPQLLAKIDLEELGSPIQVSSFYSGSLKTAYDSVWGSLRPEQRTKIHTGFYDHANRYHREQSSSNAAIARVKEIMLLGFENPLRILTYFHLLNSILEIYGYEIDQEAVFKAITKLPRPECFGAMSFSGIMHHFDADMAFVNKQNLESLNSELAQGRKVQCPALNLDVLRQVRDIVFTLMDAAKEQEPQKYQTLLNETFLLGADNGGRDPRYLEQFLELENNPFLKLRL